MWIVDVEQMLWICVNIFVFVKNFLSLFLDHSTGLEPIFSDRPFWTKKITVEKAVQLSCKTWTQRDLLMWLSKTQSVFSSMDLEILTDKWRPIDLLKSVIYFIRVRRVLKTWWSRTKQKLKSSVFRANIQIRDFAGLI